MTKAKTYSAELVAVITEQYLAGVELSEIAESAGKTVQSVRSKLVAEKVYKRPETAKRKTSVVRKIHLVEQIAEKLGVTGLESFENASKADLETLLGALEQ